jgi:hypothetical protein
MKNFVKLNGLVDIAIFEDNIGKHYALRENRNIIFKDNVEQ